MKKRLFTILIIVLVIQTSFAALPIKGNTINNSPDNFEITKSEVSDEGHIAEYWALLVGVDDLGSVGRTHMNFVNETSKNLCKNGWENDHIKLLTGDISIDDFIQGILWLKDNSKPCDTILIIIATHGGPGGFQLCPDQFEYSNLDIYLDELDYSGMAIIIQACYSGSAIPHLKQDGRVIITACGENEVSYLIDYISIPVGLDGLADNHMIVGDKNWVTSAEELFDFYIEDRFNPNRNYHPRMQDDYEGQLSLSFQNMSEEFIDILPAHPTYSEGTAYFGLGWDLVQSFIPNHENLTKVQLLIENQGQEKHDPITVTIRNSISGDNLTSSTIIPYSLEDMTRDYITFDFPDISVTPGETYYIICSSSIHLDDEDYDGYYCWEYEKFGERFLFITYSKEKIMNFPPNIPKRPAGSVYVEKNTDHNYYVTTNDVDGDNISYMFDWGDGTISGWIEPYESNEIISAAHSWTEEDIYYIKVKAKDENGLESDWSDSLKVSTIPNRPPNTPKRPYRGFLAAGMGLYRFKTTDPDNDVIYYNISWGDGNFSDWIGAYDSNEELVINHSWSKSGFYKIRVKARDKRGSGSDWSKPRRVFVLKYEDEFLTLREILFRKFFDIF